MQIGQDPKPVMRDTYNMFKGGGDPEKNLERHVRLPIYSNVGCGDGGGSGGFGGGGGTGGGGSGGGVSECDGASGGVGCGSRVGVIF
ncbi:unnamed protein product [Prunus armeniaca]